MVKDNTVDVMEDIGFWASYTLKMLWEGITPLLMHNPQGMKPTPKGMAGKEIPDPEIEAEAGAYRNAEGLLCAPARAVRATILGGAPNLKVGGRAASSVLKEAIGFLPPFEGDELFPLEDLNGKAISTYEVDIRPAVIENKGVLRARPKIWPWRLRSTLTLTVPTGTNIENFRRDLMQVANRAGQYPGFLDGRPQGRKGRGLWFGKFKLIELTIEPMR